MALLEAAVKFQLDDRRDLFIVVCMCMKKCFFMQKFALECVKKLCECILQPFCLIATSAATSIVRFLECECYDDCLQLLAIIGGNKVYDDANIYIR